MERVKIFSHNDLDGVGCAILAYLAFGRENVDVEYCNYDDVDDKVRELFASDEPVYDLIYITDISVNEETAKILNKQMIGPCLFDHHATALWLNDYTWANVRVKDKGGVKTSGTMMFYRHLCNEGYFEKYSKAVCENIDQFAHVVRDYDTWKWKETESGVICKLTNDLFHIYGREKFIDWALDGIKDENNLFPHFNETDELLLDNLQKEIDIYVSVKDKQIKVFQDKFGYKCGVVFAERFVSELGNRLSEMHPELDYISMIDLGKGTVSYRTVKDGIDLGGEIAHSFGGGGHKKAAGSTIDETFSWGIIAELFGEENDNVVMVSERSEL